MNKYKIGDLVNVVKYGITKIIYIDYFNRNLYHGYSKDKGYFIFTNNDIQKSI